MADIPSGLGWFTLTGRAIEAVADSDDAGDPPDAQLPNALVTLKVAVSDPVLIADLTAEGFPLVMMRPIGCRLLNGALYGPKNGVSGEPASTPDVRLVSSLSPALSKVGWWWNATFAPLSTGTGVVDPNDWWEPFTIAIPPVAPGGAISLGEAYLEGSTLTAAAQPTVHLGEGAVAPADGEPGQFYLDETTGDFYVIGA